MHIKTRWPMVFAMVGSIVSPVFAGNGGYFVTYNHKFEEGEKEIMIMNDFTRPSRVNREDGLNNYASQMFEFEWQFTNRFASELMLEGFEDAAGTREFTGARLESRFKVFKDDVPLNPVLYAEYEHLKTTTRFKMETSGWVLPPYSVRAEDEPAYERILETRLVLSQDFGRTNVAFNWINETNLRNKRTDFGYALGAMRLVDPEGHEHHHSGEAAGFRLGGFGLEAYGGVGDDKVLALQPARQEHYMGPLVMFHVGRESMLHISLVKGLSRTSDPFLARMALGFEF